jgi:hypothetical protein
MAMLAEAADDREAEIVADARAGRISYASADKSLAAIGRADFAGRIGKLVAKSATTANQPRGRRAESEAV